MTSTPDNTRLRLSRVENDVTAIYDMVGTVQETQLHHSAEFTAVRKKLTEHDVRFAAIDRRFDGIDGRLDGIDGRLDGIDGTLAEILRRLPETGPPS